MSKFLSFIYSKMNGGLSYGTSWHHTLDLGLDIVDGIGGFYLKSDGLPGEGFHKDLHDGLMESVRICLQPSRTKTSFGLLVY